MGVEAALTQVAFEVPPDLDLEEPLFAALESVLHVTPAIHTDLRRGVTTVLAFLPENAGPAAKLRTRVAAALSEMVEAGVLASVPEVTVSRLAAEDWAESWKRHFPPLQIEDRLLVRPSWSRQRAGRGQVEVVLDPGLSFGTGQHPTTAFCLTRLTRLKRDRGPEADRLFDIGTGSGILAICAAKLGYRRVKGIDNLSDSIQIARENAQRNGVASGVQLTVRDLDQLSDRPGERFDVVCANLVFDVLLTYRDRIGARVRVDGHLLLAGILNDQFGRVAAAYSRCGFRLESKETVEEWTSGCFRRSPQRAR